MSTTTTPVQAGAIPLTLEEFCIRLSAKDKRVELIGAFHFVEKQAGIVKDFEASFQTRFDTFSTKAV